MDTSIEIYGWPPVEIDQYDLSLVFPVDPDSGKLFTDDELIVKKLQLTLGRKYIYLCYSSNDSFIFVLIRAGLKLLKLEAEKYKWKFLLDREVIRSVAENGNEEHLIDPIYIPHHPSISRLEPYEYMYCTYTTDPDIQDLFYRTADMTHPFRKSIRIKMLMYILASTKLEKIKSPSDEESQPIDGEGEVETSPLETLKTLNLDHLHKSGAVLEYFPIHDLGPRDVLAKDWIGLCHFFSPCYGGLFPAERARDYLGEKVAIYFIFLRFLCRWLVVPTLIGIAFQVLSIYYWNTSTRPETPIFAFFILLWFISMMEYWKYEFSILCLKWNLNSSNASSLHSNADSHTVRYAFYGSLVPSYIDGKDILYFNKCERVGLYFMSCFISGLYILATIGAVCAIYYARYVLLSTIIAHWIDWVTSGMIALQVWVSNKLYYYLAVLLSEFENHRTESEFSNALIVKLFVFGFINMMTTFYYLAFKCPLEDIFDYNTKESPSTHCMDALAVNIIVILGSQSLFSVLLEFILPAVGRFLYTCWFGISPRKGRFSQKLHDNEAADYDEEEEGEEQEGDEEGGEYHRRHHNHNEEYSRGEESKEEEGYDGHHMQLESVYSGGEQSGSLQQQDYHTNPVSRKRPGHGGDSSSGGGGGGGSGGSGGRFNNRKNDEKRGGYPAKTRKEPLYPSKFSYALLESYTAKFNQYTHLVYQYNKVYMMFAVITVFGSVLPGIFLVVLVTLCFYIQGYGYQLLYQYQRLIPSEDLNTHNIHIFFEVLGLIAILSTSALIVFTMHTIHKDHFLDLTYKLCIIIGIILACSTYRYSLSKYLEGVTEEEVSIHKQRNEFLVRKLVERIPDRAENFHLDIL